MNISKDVTEQISEFLSIKSNIYGYLYSVFSNKYNDSFVGSAESILNFLEDLEEYIKKDKLEVYNEAKLLFKDIILKEERCLEDPEFQKEYFEEISNQYEKIFTGPDNINAEINTDSNRLKIILEKDDDWNDLINDYKGDTQELHNNNRRIEDFVAFELLFMHQISTATAEEVFSFSSEELFERLFIQREFLLKSTLYWASLFRKVIINKSKEVSNQLYIASSILLDVFVDYDNSSSLYLIRHIIHNDGV